MSPLCLGLSWCTNTIGRSDWLGKPSLQAHCTAPFFLMPAGTNVLQSEVLRCMATAVSGLHHNQAGREDGASFLGTDAASAPPTLLAHIVGATSQFLHCHWASRGWRGHRTLSAVTISVCSLILPPPCISIFPPSDALMSESLRHVCVQQRNLS